MSKSEVIEQLLKNKKKQQGTEILCCFYVGSIKLWQEKGLATLSVSPLSSPDQTQALCPPVIIVRSDGDLPACLIPRLAIGRTGPRIASRSRQTMPLLSDHYLRVLARSNQNIPDLQARACPEVHLISNISEAVLLPLLLHRLGVRIRRHIHAGLPIARSHEAAAGVVRVACPLPCSVVVSVAIVFAYLFRFLRCFFGDRQSYHVLSH